MPKLAANLTMLFTEYPFLERFDHAANAGFRAVEFMFPYDEPASTVLEAIERNTLELVLFNLPAGDWAAGDRGMAAQPSRTDEFREGVTMALEYLVALRPRMLNCLVGKVDPNANDSGVLVDNVRYAADSLRATATTLLVEPVNTHDVPGFALPTTQSALDLIASAGRDNLGLQYDIYHAMRMEEDPIEYIRAHGAEIRHIQIADVPGRHQPGTGNIDFRNLFDVIDGSGYAGVVSLEYIPEGRTEDGFGVMRDMGLLG
ncbi:MAG: TIM barrel protein [Chloroflexia bacterium]|nr:TIM barrel protein [Chloroflexia bacterium]